MSATQASPVPIRRRPRRRLSDNATISSRRQLEAVEAIVSALEAAGPAGLPLLGLAEETGLDMPETLRTLKRHSDYFVACGDTGKFSLNGFGQHDGDAERIRADAGGRLARFRIAIATIGAAFLLGLVLRAIGG